jgi:hypothetical protein
MMQFLGEYQNRQELIFPPPTGLLCRTNVPPLAGFCVSRASRLQVSLIESARRIAARDVNPELIRLIREETFSASVELESLLQLLFRA